MPGRQSSAGKSKATRRRKAPAGGAAASVAPQVQPPAQDATGPTELATRHSQLATQRRPSALLDNRVIPARRDCGDCLDHASEPRPSGSGPQPDPDACIDRAYVWHRLPAGEPNSNRNYQVFWGDLSEPRPSGSGPLLTFEDRHASTAPYIDYMRPRCVELARVLKKTGSFYYHCDWHADAITSASDKPLFGGHPWT